MRLSLILAPQVPLFHLLLFISYFINMGSGTSTPIRDCLDAVCANRPDCVRYPSDGLFISWAVPFNLEFPVTPTAVLRPRNAIDVSGAVKCAKENGFKFQARSGGHSYGNFGLGGVDGAVVLDLRNLKNFTMDRSTWQASIGGGMHLGELDAHLHSNGGRAMAHGTCPSVGVGGHFTIGGLGPISRLWGTSLDHVVQVEVVTADGTIRTASETENADLFWAVRGAGANFGIVTKFVVKTHPEPKGMVEYNYNFAFGTPGNMTTLYKDWQALVADPTLDRRFASLFVVQPLGVLITGTFFGTDAEYRASGIPDRLPGAKDGAIWLTNWMGHLLHEAERVGCAAMSLPTAFYTKSLALRRKDALSETAINDIFAFLEKEKSQKAPFVILFNTEGGATADIAGNATAYPHRDKIMMYQSYGAGVGKVSATTRSLLDGVHKRILRAAPNARSTYAGYVDAWMNRTAAQDLYWADNLERLRRVKRTWDPEDLFSNPQGVEPADHET
ncbi:hypothetical protein CDV31_013600 [Fusarium ambrosium]|uniref:FAD-binding PCMH-type domain-containing protein n=1 Tax=Fusarium ambrosium TaxID=131363 RepID=A0A428T285_9HYPO|nr:hypothetical protein CDV31_013600 [Fusarium ambrosium]